VYAQPRRVADLVKRTRSQKVKLSAFFKDVFYSMLDFVLAGYGRRSDHP